MTNGTYIQVRAGERKAFLARALPGGWFAVVATGTPANIATRYEQLRDLTGKNESPGDPLPGNVVPLTSRED